MRLRSRLFLLALLATPAIGRVSGAQDATPRAAGTTGITISGVVHDSIAHVPLAGAAVQLVPAEAGRAGFSASSDSLGRFTIAGVAAGRYTIGFFHPMLDSLGLQPPLREVVVAGDKPVRADLGIPSAARLRTAICGPGSARDSGGVVVGVLRDAHDGAAIAKGSVAGEWLEMSFTVGGVSRRVPRLVVNTAENGWFALCNVPSGGTMALVGSRGNDSTDRIDVEVPAEGFLRRDLYVGTIRMLAARDTTHQADTMPVVQRRLRAGDGRLTGTVVAVAGGKPLAGAQVSILEGPVTRANDRGEWTIADAPSGTRVLEVRAVGYYPERRRVDVVDGAPPVRLALSTLKAMLDTVKITASRLRGGDLSGFENRRKTGIGDFLGQEDIAKRGARNTSDIFRQISGLHIVGAEPDRALSMRNCAPTVYLDGFILPENLSIDEIDGLVLPQDIKGMEVYKGPATPGQFQQRMTGCGAVVIWTK